jgi:hypothetical protein
LGEKEKENKKVLMTNTPVQWDEFIGKVVNCGLEIPKESQAEALEVTKNMLQRNKLRL